jgi:hypothetical protein
MTSLTTPFDDVLGAPTAAAVAYVAMVTSRHRPFEMVASSTRQVIVPSDVVPGGGPEASR